MTLSAFRKTDLLNPKLKRIVQSVWASNSITLLCFNNENQIPWLNNSPSTHLIPHNPNDRRRSGNNIPLDTVNYSPPSHFHRIRDRSISSTAATLSKPCHKTHPLPPSSSPGTITKLCPTSRRFDNAALCCLTKLWILEWLKGCPFTLHSQPPSQRLETKGEDHPTSRDNLLGTILFECRSGDIILILDVHEVEDVWDISL